MSLIGELQRRNVFRFGIAYIAGGWLVWQLAGVSSELASAPVTVVWVIVFLVVTGFCRVVLKPEPAFHGFRNHPALITGPESAR